MDNYQVYLGNDLGANYTPDKTTFRLWAPTAERVQVCLYREGNGDCLFATENMSRDKDGTWIFRKGGDLDQVYYTYRVTVDGITRETIDPYAKAAGVNGERGMVVDLFGTNPDGFLEDRGPVLESPTDAVICEVSVADMTMDSSSGVKFGGKYLGLAENGTKSPQGLSTGIDYLKELGVTHVQIMPAYDFGSIDESKPQKDQYNWGYDPVNYNIPEGSYSTDPFHGEVRIREFKEMVRSFHSQNIGVIMDVVFNHTYDIEHSCFQKTVPDYFYRKTESGYSDASACGNEIASEKPMMRKYIIDSVTYWAREYHIDGFRFDLMGILDIETMQQVRDALHKISPSIIVYGEGWTAAETAIPAEKCALKRNIAKLNGVGAFSDDIRDIVGGDIFHKEECGFVNGEEGLENAIRFSVVGAVPHPEVSYEQYTYTPSGPWAKNPADTVNYVSCHDNMTLWDKLRVKGKDVAEEELLAQNRLCAAIIFTAQGIPFFLSGEEIARTKPREGSDEPVENSYNLPFYTNSIKYGRAVQYAGLLKYYKGLIAFRKEHAGLRMGSANEVVKNLHFIPQTQKNVVAYTITTEDEIIFIVYNANRQDITVSMPQEGAFQVYIAHDMAGTDVLGSAAGKVKVKAVSCLAAVKKLNG